MKNSFFSFHSPFNVVDMVIERTQQVSKQAETYRSTIFPIALAVVAVLADSMPRKRNANDVNRRV